LSISQRKIRELLSTGENPRLDYKLLYNLRDAAAKTELAKDGSAIANYLYQTSGQGHLIIGANDNGIPVGINPSDYQEIRIQQIISNRTDPPPTFTVHHVNYSGFNLLIIKLRRSARET
jgi:predicted HTH transcriptional regulator